MAQERPLPCIPTSPKGRLPGAARVGLSTHHLTGDELLPLGHEALDLAKSQLLSEPCLPRLEVKGVDFEGVHLCDNGAALPVALRQVRTLRSRTGATGILLSVEEVTGSSTFVEQGNWWLFVASDSSVADELLDTLASAGAVRPNLLEKGWTLASSAAIGSGGFGSVYKLRATEDTRKLLAMKVPSLEGDQDSLTAKLLHEVRMTAQAQGQENIVGLHGAFQTVNSGRQLWAIGLELCAGDLLQLLQLTRLREPSLKKIFKGLLKALEHIHERGIIHRDVKPENIFIKDTDRAVLGDFGLACSANPLPQRTAGTAGYMAPEVRLGQAWGRNSDLFGLGSSLFFAAQGRNPFGDDEDTRSTMSFLGSCALGTAEFEGMSALLKDLIKMLLHACPRTRPEAQTASQHCWLTSPFLPQGTLDSCGRSDLLPVICRGGSKTPTGVSTPKTPSMVRKAQSFTPRTDTSQTSKGRAAGSKERATGSKERCASTILEPRRPEVDAKPSQLRPALVHRRITVKG